MNIKHEDLVQDIFLRFYSKPNCTALIYLCNYIVIGYSGRNFVFEVLSPERTEISRKWHGEVHLIKSFEEAERTILLECLPF